MTGNGQRGAAAGRGPLVPGEVIARDEPVAINVGKPVTRLRVENTADRPIQVGSHFHFAEVNAGLAFDRDAAWGTRLAVLSGSAVRFEPGAAVEVELVPIGGRRIVAGLRGLCGGALDG
jgi:urease subunit beta